MNLLRKTETCVSKNEYLQIPASLWCAVLLTYCLLIPLHTYNDILITAKHGYSFWTLLFEGRPLDFYFETAEMTTGNAFYPYPQNAAYLFPIYFIFAIWNFPTWLLERITGQSLFNTIPSMIWMKLMLVPFIAASAVQIFKIVNKSERCRKHAYLAVFLFCSSILTVYPTAIIGQYDILGIPFLLIGINKWLDNDRKGFIIAFSIAMVFKYFALLYFLPLLLFREKKIRRIMVDFVLVLVPSLFFAVLFPRPEGNETNLDAIYLLLTGISVNERVIIYGFPITAVLVCIVAYFIQQPEGRFDQWGNYFLMIILGAFCALADPFPYWVIFAVPAFALCSVSSENNINKVLILETVLSWAITIKNYIIYHWCFGVATVGGMGVLHRLLRVHEPQPSESYSVFMGSYVNLFIPVDVLESGVFNVMIVAFALLIYIASPKRRSIEQWEPLTLGTVYCRTIGNVVLAFLPVIYIAVHMLLIRN